MKTVRLDIKSSFFSLSGSRKMRFLSFGAGGSSLPIVDPTVWEWPGLHGGLTGTQAPPPIPVLVMQTRLGCFPCLSFFHDLAASKNYSLAKEMARVIVSALIEDLNLIPSTHIR